MERERKDILISDLIYKSLRGSLKGDEADILDAWLEKPENREELYGIYYNLLNEGFRFAETVFILLLGIVTVDSIRRMMVTLRDSHTPFTEGIASSMKAVSIVYLISSFVLLALEIAAGSTVTEALFIFLGTLLVCVVMYCLSIVFRYGAVLQDESDHTL